MSSGIRVRARRGVVLAIAAAGVGGTFAITAAPLAHAAVHTVSSNGAAGRAAAIRRLAHAALPPGATPVATDPEAVTPFQRLLTAVSDTPSGSNVVDVHQFFRVPERPAAVFRWLSRHRPRGSKLSARGHAVVHGRTVDRSISFVFPGIRDTITQEGVGFEVTAAQGGGSAVRVEAWAVWFVPRPAFERIPTTSTPLPYRSTVLGATHSRSPRSPIRNRSRR